MARLGRIHGWAEGASRCGLEERGHDEDDREAGLGTRMDSGLVGRSHDGRIHHRGFLRRTHSPAREAICLRRWTNVGWIDIAGGECLLHTLVNVDTLPLVKLVFAMRNAGGLRRQNGRRAGMFGGRRARKTSLLNTCASGERR